MSEKISTKPVKEIKLPTGVLSLDVTADGSTAYAACIDGGIFSVALESGTTKLLGRHESYASGVGLVADSNLLVSAGYDGALQWYDLKEAKVLRKIQAHGFWSWQSAVSPDGALVASVTGQYICGDYKYKPLAERGPSVRVYDARTGELRYSFSHVPPVQSVAFSSDGKFLAAGELDGRGAHLGDGRRQTGRRNQHVQFHRLGHHQGALLHWRHLRAAFRG